MGGSAGGPLACWLLVKLQKPSVKDGLYQTAAVGTVGTQETAPPATTWARNGRFVNDANC